jgi:hypothetical protein
MLNLIFKILIFCTGCVVIAQETDTLIVKQIALQSDTTRTKTYHFLWGKHYKKAFAEPISALDISTQFDEQNKVILFQGKQYELESIAEDLYYFQRFPDFNKLYQEEDFEGTFAQKMIADAYTMHYPFGFLIANEVAKNLQLSPYDLPYFYKDNKLYKGIPSNQNLITTDSLITLLQTDFKYKIDSELYVRSRLLDMLVGNSSKVAHDYLWKSKKQNSDLIFSPVVTDRGFSFLKKDGLLFDFLLQSIGIDFADNYYKNKLNVKKINRHNYATDVVLASTIPQEVWIEQARFIREILTIDVLENIFNELPTSDIQELLKAFEFRLENLEIMAEDYGNFLQKTIVIFGSHQDDTFVINQTTQNTEIELKTSTNQTIALKKQFSNRRTKEIWLHGFSGNDIFRLENSSDNGILIRIMDENGGDFEVAEAQSNIKIYVPESLEDTGKAKVYTTDNPKILEYSPQKPQPDAFKFDPWLVFDTDMLVRIGAKLSYTQNNFKKNPYDFRHELGWNHYYSLVYKGSFPSLDEKRMYVSDVWITSQNHFQNFFGFGNESENYESNFGLDYNRVLMQKFGLSQSIIFNKVEKEHFSLKVALEHLSVIDNQKFDRDDIFRENELRNTANILSSVSGGYFKEYKTQNWLYALDVEAGLVVNFRDMNRNIPYLEATNSLEYNMPSKRNVTLATVLGGKAMFNPRFEFYQAATIGGETGLRGFRNERFAGQHYFYQNSDIRIDLGKLKNNITPLSYQAFVGFDYGRVWLEGENSQKWHTSIGGGFSFRFFNKVAAQISYFTSSESPRIIFALGYQL